MNLSLVTWIVRSYMLDIPPEIEDAARTDGASDLRILVSIIVPMCLPGIITAGVIAVTFAINEFLFTLLIASTQMSTRPVPPRVRRWTPADRTVNPPSSMYHTASANGVNAFR